MSSEYPVFVQTKIVDQGGDLTNEFSNYFQQSNTYIQNNLSQQGFVVPNLTTTEINNITAADNARKGETGAAAPQLYGALYYDTTTNNLKLNKSGTIVVVV